MNKRQVISSLNNIAEELDNQGLYVEAKQISNVMRKIAQMEAQPDTRSNILKMLDINFEYMRQEIIAGNPIKKDFIDHVNKVKSDVNALSNILPLYLNKPI